MRFFLPLALIALTTLAVVWGKPAPLEVREHSSRPDYVVFQRCVGLGCSERKPYAAKRGALDGLGLFERAPHGGVAYGGPAHGGPTLLVGGQRMGSMRLPRRETATASNKPVYSKFLALFKAAPKAAEKVSSDKQHDSTTPSNAGTPTTPQLAAAKPAPAAAVEKPAAAVKAAPAAAAKPEASKLQARARPPPRVMLP